MEARAAGGHWADEAVTALNNIYGSGVFQASDETMSLSDAATVLQAMGCESEKLPNPGSGDTSSFTRGTACEVLAEVFQLPLEENQSAIEYLYKKNIINGDASGNLDADGAITKAQFAVITYRVLNSVGGGKGSSNEALKPGTKEYFAWMYLAARSCVPFNTESLNTAISSATVRTSVPVENGRKDRPGALERMGGKAELSERAFLDRYHDQRSDIQRQRHIDSRRYKNGGRIHPGRRLTNHFFRCAGRPLGLRWHHVSL